MIPLYKVGLPWEEDFDWRFTNYTILWFAGIGLIFGGWWVLSAKNWFKGPVRMGTEEELERYEEELERRTGTAPVRRELARQRAPHGVESSAGASSSARASRSGACVPGIATQRMPAALAAATPASVSSKTVTSVGAEVAVEELEGEQVAGRVGLPALDVLDRDHDRDGVGEPGRLQGRDDLVPVRAGDDGDGDAPGGVAGRPPRASGEIVEPSATFAR